MIIENPDAFKSWLTSILEPLCDADPPALAKYVYALVKKDKPLDELREGMLDQLDVFLQQETKPFVDMLFKTLETQEYLKEVDVEKKEPSPPPEPVVSAEKENEEENHAEYECYNVLYISVPVSAAVPAEKPVARPRADSAGHRTVVPRSRAHTEQTLVKVLPTELLEEPVDPPRRRDRRTDSGRDKDERRRRRSHSWERRGRARRPPRAEHERRCGRISRSPSPRGRYRNRSPPAADRHTSRSRSRSPALRERELERERVRPQRELERDRMSRDREHRDRISRSRDRERSRDRSMSPPGTRLEHADSYRRRCRDFDVKGYCMRGDLCEWDHGADPVVLEDAALSRVLALPPAPLPAPVPEYNPAAPDIWGGGVVGYAPPALPPPRMATRELVPIPRVRHEAGPPPPRHAPPGKKSFDYNRLGTTRPPLPANAANCSLEVKKVPRGLNDITHLNNHFSKFGKIVNIQVCYEGDPEAAIITFSNPTEANVAYKSTEAVLNNRFIKVFWHNPENKQENTAPGGQQPNKPTDSQNHLMSHNKVLINRENIKATADIKQAEKAKETSNGQQPALVNKPAVKAGNKQVVEVHRRAQELLRTQLQQQRLLIQRLESGNVTEQQRDALLKAINAAQEGIEKLSKELIANNGMLKQIQDESVARSMSRLQLDQVNAKKPKTLQEVQKDILDAELDIITKQQEGQDVTELAKKIADMRRQMALQYPTFPTPRRAHSRGGRFSASLRYQRGAKAYSVNQSVDHRPRTLLVSGFEPEELDSVTAHFAQFGEIAARQADATVPQLLLQFRARAGAELAAARARLFGDRTLSITWVSNNKALTAAPAQNGDSAEHKDTENQKEPTSDPLRFDEDEEDEEDRSWRR
ncbi:RNA-binding protein 26 [Melitaea cinxia]|uniref:RNA-binding protein 26 n=1 Tax=Melitaea cinxia TaxID=113334 RepID=UPI001E272C02|nr:RNA-binding protein 26 [Melitaea cinxia]